MTVYESVINTCKLYLGPASEQFISRQCSLHLKVEPQSLGKQHLPELAHYVEVGGLRFMEAAKVKELSGKLSRL